MRRPNGTGTITKLSGNRRKPYVVRISEMDTRGYVVQRSLGYYAKSADAQAALDDYNAKKEAGTAPHIEKLSMTVQAVYDLWSAREFRKLNRASITSHKAAWNKRVSRLADRKIRDTSLDDWQSILDDDEDTGMSQSTINNDAILMSALCSFAMERDIIGKDYTEYLDIPHVGAKVQKGAFDDLQMAKLEKLAADGFPWADTVLMLCYTGFRISEFLELTRFSYSKEENYLQGGKKTAAGKNRIVPVHQKIKPYLDKWLFTGGDAIICGDDGKPIPVKRYREKMFQPVMDAIGAAEATPHWCRHTFATRAKVAGMDDLAIRRIMGHSDKNVTEGYTHGDIKWLSEELQKVV